MVTSRKSKQCPDPFSDHFFFIKEKRYTENYGEMNNVKKKICEMINKNDLREKD